MPRKPLMPAPRPTLPAAGVGWFLTRPGCLTASAGCGAEPQALSKAYNRSLTYRSATSATNLLPPLASRTAHSNLWPTTASRGNRNFDV